MRGPSPITVVLIPTALALSVNLATDTVTVPSWWWPWVTWTLTGLLVTASAVIETRHRRGRHDVPPAEDGQDGQDGQDGERGERGQVRAAGIRAVQTGAATADGGIANTGVIMGDVNGGAH